MAVYHGARRRGVVQLGSLTLPRPMIGRPAVPETERPEADAGRRARTRTGDRAAARPRFVRPSRVGTALAAIVVVFIVAFVSLSQSVRVAATSYDIVRLASERDRLDALRLDLRSDLDRLGGEPAIRKLSLDHGLGQLGAPLVLPAR